MEFQYEYKEVVVSSRLDITSGLIAGHVSQNWFLTHTENIDNKVVCHFHRKVGKTGEEICQDV